MLNEKSIDKRDSERGFRWKNEVCSLDPFFRLRVRFPGCFWVREYVFFGYPQRDISRRNWLAPTILMLLPRWIQKYKTNFWTFPLPTNNLPFSCVLFAPQNSSCLATQSNGGYNRDRSFANIVPVTVFRGLHAIFLHVQVCNVHVQSHFFAFPKREMDKKECNVYKWVSLNNIPLIFHSPLRKKKSSPGRKSAEGRGKFAKLFFQNLKWALLATNFWIRRVPDFSLGSSEQLPLCNFCLISAENENEADNFPSIFHGEPSTVSMIQIGP